MSDGRHSGDQRGGVDAAQVEQQVPGLGQGDVTGDVGAHQVGQLSQDDVDGDAGQEPDHHRVRHEPGEAPHSKHGGHDHERARDQGQEEQRLRPPVGRNSGDGGARSERGGARRGDDHQLAARGEPTADGAEDAGVEPVHGVDAGQDACGHPVRDAADGSRNARDHVLLEGGALRSEVSQPARHRRDGSVFDAHRLSSGVAGEVPWHARFSLDSWRGFRTLRHAEPHDHDELWRQGCRMSRPWYPRQEVTTAPRDCLDSPATAPGGDGGSHDGGLRDR